MKIETHARTYWRTLRLFNRPVRLYLCAEWLSGFTVDGGIYTVLFNLYLLRSGYSLTFIGAINAAGYLTFGLWCLPAGLLGGRVGSLRMLMAGAGVMAVGCGLLPLAEILPSGWRASWLIATYVLIYMGLGLHFANSTPFVMTATSTRERNHVFSTALALWFLAGFAGNMLGGHLPALFASALGTSLEEPAPYRCALLLAAFLLTPSVLALRAARGVSRHRPTEASPNVDLRTRLGPGLCEVRGVEIHRSQTQRGQQRRIPFGRIGWLALSRLLQVTGVASVFLFLNVYLDQVLDTETSDIAALLAIGRLAAVPAALLAPLLMVRWGRHRLIVGASVGIALSLLPLAFVPHWSAAMLSSIGVVSLTAIRIPVFLGYSMEYVSSEHRATMSGASEMANGLGFSLVGLGGGHIIAAWGYRPLFLLSAVLTAVGTLTFWLFCRMDESAYTR